MQYQFKGTRPQVSEGVFIAHGARVIGQVTLGRDASIWYNTVVRGDSDTITIGDGSNVQDQTLVHCDGGFPVTIGRDCTIGHSCIIHGCTIGDNVLVGMGSTILNGARIGENSLIGAGSLITEGKEFPPGSVIMGRPAKVIREVSERELDLIRIGHLAYKQNASAHAEGTSPV